jgi:hypothetical protein
MFETAPFFCERTVLTKSTVQEAKSPVKKSCKAVLRGGI